MKLNNKGLSLVEIIIVVAIMTVMTGLVSFGVGTVVSKPADECAQKLTNTLKNARITAMGKKSCEVKVTQAYNGAPIYIEVSTDGSSQPTIKIGEKGVNFTITSSDGTNVDIKNLYEYSGGMILSFNRSTGGFNKANLGGATTAYVSEISVSKGTLNKKVKLSKLTGRVTVE